MKYTIIGSGSKGNCNIIQSKNTTIVIDCGCSISYTNEMLKQINVDIEKIDGLLITHEHSDHIKSIRMMSKIPVYSPIPFVFMNSQKIVNPYQLFEIGDFSIVPIALSHDSNICVGYIISDGKEVLVQVTDTGYVSETNLKLIMGADYYIFESNHDPEMLMKTNRPAYLKKRILSDEGHMSNEYASEILAKCISKKTKEIVLGHISQEANTYKLAYDTLIEVLNRNKIDYKKIKIKAVEQFELYSGGKIE